MLKGMHLSRGYRILRYGFHQNRFLKNATTVRKIHGGSVRDALEQLKDIAVTPEQPDLYKEAVKIYNPAYSYEHPAFVALPNNTDDIKRCLHIANKTGAPVAVKSGGTASLVTPPLTVMGLSSILKILIKFKLRETW